MTEALEETGTLSRGDEAAEADGGDEERPRVTPERVEEIASGLRRAAEMAEARAKEAAMNHLEALVMSPSRRRRTRRSRRRRWRTPPSWKRATATP